MKPRIGIVSAYTDAEAEFGYFAQTFNCELLFRIGYLDTAIDLINELRERQGVNAVVTQGIPLEIIQEIGGNSVYPVYPTNYEVLSSIYEAMENGRKIAFAEMRFETILFDLVRISKILQCDIAHYIFQEFPAMSHRQRVETVVNKIIEDGHDVMVTMGGYSHAYACKCGYPSVLVKPEAQSIQIALENVNRVYLSHKIEAEKNQWLNAVFDSQTEGVTVINRDKIVMVMNSSARRFMHLTKSEIIGKHLDEIKSPNPLFERFNNIPGNYDIVKGRTKEYVVRKEVLYAGEAPLGTIIRAQPVKDLQRMEMDARRKINESGFVAKANFGDIQGSSPAFQRIKDKARSYAKSKSNIVLYGESGSGKEIFAQSIHNNSLCSDGPFVAINCTVLTESLLESELFGYEDGAFTGAKKGGKPGLFELAHKGTMFLDEIGDMPTNIQVKLLRVLQERTVRRIGGNKNIPIDVRLIFATNRDLQSDVQKGMFREDLYYRINVLVLKIPPLREHREDLRDISLDIIKKLSAQTGKLFKATDAMFHVLAQYDWPGNVRELHNFWERAFFLEQPDDNSVRNMVDELISVGGSAQERAPIAMSNTEGDLLTLGLDSMRNIENAVIRSLFERYRGNRKKVSDTLQISPSSLYRRLKEMGVSGE